MQVPPLQGWGSEPPGSRQGLFTVGPPGLGSRKRWPERNRRSMSSFTATSITLACASGSCCECPSKYKQLHLYQLVRVASCSGGFFENALHDFGGLGIGVHGDESAFAEGAEPGFLPAGELAGAGFDAVDAGEEGLGA